VPNKNHMGMKIGSFFKSQLNNRRAERKLLQKEISMTSSNTVRRAVRHALFIRPPGKRTAERSVAAALVATGSLFGAVATGVGMFALPITAAYADSYTNVDLSGQVVDQNGKIVPGASVSIKSDQGVVRKATADQNGEFRMLAMPSGTYLATISAPGFTSVENQSIRVASGSNTYSFTIVPAGTVLNKVVVSAARVVQDFNKTDSGLAVDVQEMSERVPLGRSINAAVALAPSVSFADPSIVANGVRRNQSAVSVSGTSAAESVYYINGLNVTDQRTFLGYSDLPFEMIKSVEVKTGGYQAEYGRGTGGVVNIVTRSGSNDFHFGVSAFYTPDSMRSSRDVTYAPGGNNSVGIKDLQYTVKNDFSEETVWVSGPLMTDHIFFFALVNPRQSDAWSAVRFANPTTNNGTWLNTSYDDPRWAAKLDFVLNENHRLEATVFSDLETTSYENWNYGRAQGAILPVAGLSNPDGSLLPYEQEAGGINSILQYTGTFSQWFTLSALVGQTNSSYKDSGPYIETPGIVDFGTTGGSITLGRQAGPFNFVGKDTRDTYRVDADVFFKAAGEHHVRVGYDYEDLTSTANSAYTGGALYYGYSTVDCPAGAGAAGCVEKLTFANIGEFGATQSAAYIQDSWEVTSNLALQLGVRSDIYDYKNANGESYIKIDGQIAPRLGLTWDPFSNGQNQVTVSYGTYYLPIATNTSIRASSGEIYTDEYFQTVRDGAGNLVLNNGYPTMGAQIGPTDYFSPPGAPDPRSVIEQDLKPMYEAAFSVELKHNFRDNFLEGWTAGLRYTQRELKSTIEDTAIGDAVCRYRARNGLVACAAGETDLFPYVLVNPGDGARVFMDLEGDSRSIGGVANPAYNPQWLDLTTADMALDKAKRMYYAVEFNFERPFDGTWGVLGSYTWSRSIGNYEGAVKSDIGQTDTSITQDFDHAANNRYGYGYLPNDHRHTFKVLGTWSPINRLTIGTNLVAQSGRPYGCIGYVNPATDPYAPQSGTPSAWSCPQTGPATGTFATGSILTQLNAVGGSTAIHTSVPVTRGTSGRTEWAYQADLNFGYKVFESDSHGEASVLLDVFNVFDGDAVTRVVEQGEVRTATHGISAPFYGMPRTYQGPRSVRIGFRYAF
jgi:hypothetical protein